MPTTSTSTVDGAFVDLEGRRFYRIGNYDRLEPFLMTLASATDVWCFLSSTGGLTAGRVDPDHALFPYDTDDRVADSAGRTGGLTLIRVAGQDGRPQVWEPLTGPAANQAERAIFKDALGTTVVFEESRHDLGLRMRVAWSASDRFGLVRQCELSAADRVTVDLVDGLVNLLPAGVTEDTQRRRSNLLHAYKRAEVDPKTGLALLYLNSRLTDLAEPSECLSATVAWQQGLNGQRLLSTRQLPAFRDGGPVSDEPEVRGEPCAYLVSTRLTLAPGEGARWVTVADVDYDAADVVALGDLLRDLTRAGTAVVRDLEQSRDRLERMLAGVDACQLSGEETASTHHLANVLFNSMRGGLPANGYVLDAADVRAFIAQRSPQTAQRCQPFLASLPDRVPVTEFRQAARTAGDADLERLAVEYLPLTFSRRHGDPSRPWNKYRISLRDAAGEPELGYEGNWRDILQNWEAMARSYPEYLDSMISIFVNATTADGYNPYRITREGIDWEVLEPDDPWSNIGYWSDHQIIYLLRLLEASEHFYPGRLQAQLHNAIHTHADVPYRLATYQQTLVDPYDTVTFDDERAEAIEEREAREGADARLVHDVDGRLVHATLAEKLLLLLAAKLVNYVPDGGIWMNTQRPEWNDANNALVGRGLSVVTLAYLRRYLVFLQHLLVDDVRVNPHLAALLRRINTAFDEHSALLDGPAAPPARRQLMDVLGEAGTEYRAAVYRGIRSDTDEVSAAEIQGLLSHARQHVESSLRANARPDHLFHSYNLLDLDERGANVRRLPEMLEGQVAILSSGMLDVAQSRDLLFALRDSALYVGDRHSYLLYPDRHLPGFLEHNTVSAADAGDAPLAARLVEVGDRSIVVPDQHGDLHFAADLRNEKDVGAALERLADHPDLADDVAAGGDGLLRLFEKTFNHAEFTGRAGSFFAYEGLGSVYWHMVSKLLLAIQEVFDSAQTSGADEETLEELAARYDDVRTGLGYCRTPEQYGAFPTDPYSHTPAGHGARQPGMTGLVKEEILTRLGELGLHIENGTVLFRGGLLRTEEAMPEPGELRYVDVHGEPASVAVPQGSLAFTFCRVPVLVSAAERLAVRVNTSDGRTHEFPDGVVPADLSGSIFRGEGSVTSLDVHLPGWRDQR